MQAIVVLSRVRGCSKIWREYTLELKISFHDGQLNVVVGTKVDVSSTDTHSIGVTWRGIILQATPPPPRNPGGGPKTTGREEEEQGGGREERRGQKRGGVVSDSSFSRNGPAFLWDNPILSLYRLN